MVTEQLRIWLARAKDRKEKAETWARWVDIWSQFTLVGFLESSYEAILTKIPHENDQEGLEELSFTN